MSDCGGRNPSNLRAMEDAQQNDEHDPEQDKKSVGR